MRYTTFILLLILFACDTAQHKESPAETAERESFIKHYVDSATKISERKAIFDTVGLSGAPVRVIRARLVKQEYSSYKDIELTFKNVGDKVIDGIRFKWYGENVFGDPADMGSGGLLEGLGGGFTDKKIRPGQSMSLQWSILSRDAKRVLLAWPYEIVYADGTKWEIK